MGKTLRDVRGFTSRAKKNLAGKPCVENFGRAAVTHAHDMAGSIEDYNDRLTAIGVAHAFSEWCATYTGR
jgi:hypothetical protein